MNKPIATISRTNEILKKYNLFAKKGYGQNFIVEPSIVEKIAVLSKANKETCTIEIGPGIGALTEQLAKLSRHVYAFEIDNRLIDVLKDTLSDYDNIEICNADFLEINLEEIVEELNKKYGKVTVCANLPYYITTPILFKIFESKADITNITVMMQKEVADRFNATVNSDTYNALSVIVQYLYDVKVVMKIPRTIFNPQPNVDSSVVQFIKKEDKKSVYDEKEFFELVKACFKQRRKTLYNNLREYLKDADKAKLMLEKCEYKENVRAQELNLEDFIRLYEVTYDR